METVTLPPPVAVDPSRPPDLLPAFLSGPAAALWLWVMPMAVLLALNAEGYWILSGDMDSTQRGFAHAIGLAGMASIAAGLLVGFARRRCAQSGNLVGSHSWVWGATAIAINVAYLWVALGLGDDVLPRGASLWIYPPERFFGHQLIFAMLPLFVGVLQASCAGVSHRLGRTLAWSLGVAVFAPVLLYLALEGLSGSAHGGDGVILAIYLILFSLAMFIGIVRALMVGLKFASQWRRASETVAIALVAGLLPAGALAVNSSIAFPVDFQSWEVYALAGANAAVMFFASAQRERRPRLAFNLLCATLPFSLYFFLVVLPYTPLAIFAILLAGFGFLLLTPILLFVLHLYLLNRARSAVTDGLGWRRTVLPAVACFFVLPGFVVYRACADRDSLHAAVDYAFAPTVRPEGAHFRGDPARTRRALVAYGDFKAGVYYPFLSDFYNWVVFDRLVLPDAKLAELERIFGGAANPEEAYRSRRGRRRESFAWGSSVRDHLLMPRRRPVPRSVHVAQVECEPSAHRSENQAYTLKLLLENTGTENAEYVASLPLPSGVLVRGFRLQVGDVLVPGRIFEKKTALWVYAMIRDGERRDPGVLYYRGAEELELRVFPVLAGKPARVEIEFLLPSGSEPRLTASSDPAALVRMLGNGAAPRVFASEERMLFVAGRARAVLPAVQRSPYFHLIVDRSEGNGFDGHWGPVLQALHERYPAVEEARVTAANVDIRDVARERIPLDRVESAAGPAELGRTLPSAHGCALDLAVAHALRLHRDADLDAPRSTGPLPGRPIVVVVGRNSRDRLAELPFADAWSDYDDTLELVQVDATGKVVAHRQPRAPASPLLRFGSVLRPLGPGGVAAFPATPGARLEYWSPDAGTWQPLSAETDARAGKDWLAAISLWQQSRDYARSPGERSFALPALVAASRDTGVLTPVTSYIVVESQAQWRMLQLSERQKLSQNDALEFRETPVPPAFWIALGFAAWLWLRRTKWATLSRTSPV